MKNNLRLLLVLLSFQPLFGFGQGDTPIRIKTDIFTVVYSEVYEQPLQVNYKVLCPMGDASREGLDFRKWEGVKTSDKHDYSDNPYDKGHMAPAAAFNCSRDMVKATFSYLNCALQHQGLNRGPWKELERFERNLAKIWEDVNVTIYVEFHNEPQYVKGGAQIPSGFRKIIEVEGVESWEFYFPNKDVSGTDWINFQVPLSRKF
mgnify:FL=1